MMSNTLQTAINEQIKHELFSAYAYLAMSAYCESENLTGAAKWLRAQAQEEIDHAMKFFDFIQDRGGRVTLLAIEQPPTEYKSLLDVFQHALAHEEKITGLINNIYEIAVKEKDYPAQVMLQWFIEEQVEEEKNAGLVVAQLKMIGDQPNAVLIFDRHLGARGE